MPELRFLPNDADIDEGLADAGIETFRDSPYASVARECGQNSADAQSGTPVKVAFDLLEIPVTELPSYLQYRSAVNNCLEKARNANNEKEMDFFFSAVETLGKDTLKILKVSDSNTKGLIGPCKPGAPFHSLLKASGVSTKEQEGSGGSFGIGKNAAFAVSNIQTVFYSTIYIDNSSNDEVFLCQGKSILVSHIDERGEAKLSRGFWGEDSFQPVNCPSNIPEWLTRDKVGTSLYCIGFRESDDWQARITASILQNFFCAIHRGNMEFSVNSGEIQINKNTLWQLFRDSRFEKTASESGNKEDYAFSRNLLECLTAVETKEETVNIPDFGEVSIRVLVREDLPKRIGIVRNGMFITDNLNNFGHKFVKFPLYKEFVAFVEPIDMAGITLLKKLENPRHDSFSAERLSDAVKRKTADKAMKKLGDKIRDIIRSQTVEKPQSSVVLNELSEFFADEVDPERIQDPDALDDDPETPLYSPVKPVPPKQSSRGDDSGEEGGAASNNGTNGTGGGAGPGAGSGTGGRGNSGGGKILPLNKIRNVILDNNMCKRRIFFTPPESTSARLDIIATGINTVEVLKIQRTSTGDISDHSLKLELQKGVRTTIDVDFRDKYDGPIELRCRSITNENVKDENQ